MREVWLWILSVLYAYSAHRELAFGREQPGDQESFGVEQRPKERAGIGGALKAALYAVPNESEGVPHEVHAAVVTHWCRLHKGAQCVSGWLDFLGGGQAGHWLDGGEGITPQCGRTVSWGTCPRHRRRRSRGLRASLHSALQPRLSKTQP